MAELNRSITPLMLWAMGVGCAFAGLFFGWNLGLARGGTLGLGLALVVVLGLQRLRLLLGFGLPQLPA